MSDDTWRLAHAPGEAGSGPYGAARDRRRQPLARAAESPPTASPANDAPSLIERQYRSVSKPRKTPAPCAKETAGVDVELP